MRLSQNQNRKRAAIKAMISTRLTPTGMSQLAAIVHVAVVLAVVKLVVLVRFDAFNSTLNHDRLLRLKRLTVSTGTSMLWMVGRLARPGRFGVSGVREIKPISRMLPIVKPTLSCLRLIVQKATNLLKTTFTPTLAANIPASLVPESANVTMHDVWQPQWLNYVKHSLPKLLKCTASMGTSGQMRTRAGTTASGSVRPVTAWLQLPTLRLSAYLWLGVS